MPVVEYGGNGAIKVVHRKDAWEVCVHSNYILVPVSCDTDIFGVASTGDGKGTIKSWDAFFIWDDNKWIRVDHWDDLSDDQKCTLARWYYSKWSPWYTATDYLPWVGTNIHALIVRENL